MVRRALLAMLVLAGGCEGNGPARTTALTDSDAAREVFAALTTAFSDSTGIDLPFRIRAGSWDYMGEPRMADAMRDFGIESGRVVESRAVAAHDSVTQIWFDLPQNNPDKVTANIYENRWRGRVFSVEVRRNGDTWLIGEAEQVAIFFH
ncbi:MAG: hypothetical protein F4187_05925 [Gemmatimonadetes bacterium]|nr:hypothetical protein [Gemmatimonadota bacterium]